VEAPAAIIGPLTDAEGEMNENNTTTALFDTAAAPAAAPAPTTPKARARDRPAAGWAPVAALGVGTFAISTDLFVVAGLLGPLAADLHVTVGVAGLAVTAFALAYAVGAPVLGVLLGGRSHRAVLITALVVFGLCAAVSAMAPTVAVLLVTRVAAGLAASVYGPTGAATAVTVYPPSHHGRALGGLQASSSVALIVGAPVGLMLAETVSWRAAFGLVAVLTAIAVLGLLRCDVGSAALTVSTARERFRPLRSRAVLGVLGATFLMMAASNSMYSYLGVLVGAATEPAGLWAFIAAFGVGGVLGTWWGGTAADRRGGTRVVLLAAAVQTVALAVLLVGPVTPAAELAIAVGWGFAGWALVTGQQHRLAGLGSRSASFVMALNSSAIQFGFGVGALLGGLVVDGSGAAALPVLALGLGCAGVLVLAVGAWEVRS
jgi:predicted MFS family arabinose efflux permease